MSVDDKQVGGDHYKTEIQHWNYVLANDIPYLEAQVIKYLTRWRRKNGHQDILKARHFLDKLMEYEGLGDVYDARTPEWLRQVKEKGARREASTPSMMNHQGAGRGGIKPAEIRESNECPHNDWTPLSHAAEQCCQCLIVRAGPGVGHGHP